MASDPKFTLQQNGSLVVVTIEVKIFTSSLAAELIEMFRKRLKRQDGRDFALDMSAVEFIDSTCIGMLVGFLQDLVDVGGSVALAGCRANVAFIFEVTRLDMVFKMFDTIDEAKAALAPESGQDRGGGEG